MEQKPIFIHDPSTWDHDYNMSGKLYCTFTIPEKLDETISEITRRYSILYNKIFVLESPDSSEYICTYNVDSGNIADIMRGTITLHRKKEWNVLYSINALNALIRSLNEGFLNDRFAVNWEDYKNCILLTNGPNELRKLNTKIHQIVNV